MASHVPTKRERVKEAASVVGIVLLSPLFLAYIGHHKLDRLYKLHTSDDPQYKSMRQQRQHQRRKSLTLSSPVADSEQRRSRFNLLSRGDARTLNPQLHSRLFALPAEIRLQIYKYIICIEPFVHLEWATRLWDCVPLEKSGIPSCNLNRARSRADHFTENEIVLARNHVACLESMGREPEFGTRMYGILPLLQSCRRVYTEAIDMLYAHNIFTATLEYNFLNLARSIPNRHLTTIRSLILHLPQDPDFDRGYLVSVGFGWGPSLQVLRGMPNLQRCLFQILTDFYIDEHCHERSVIQGLFKGLKQLPTKDVFIIDWMHYANTGYDGLNPPSKFCSWGTTLLKELDDEDPWESWLSVFDPYEKKKARSKRGGKRIVA